LTPLIRAGVLTPRQINNGGTGFSIDEIRRLTAFTESLPPPPGEGSDLLPLVVCFNRLARRHCAGADFLHSILTRKTTAYSPDLGLLNIVVPGEALRHAKAVATLRHMISHGRYADLSRINGFTRQLWGPLAFVRAREATQLVAAGKLRFRRSNYGRRGEPNIYNVGDIVRDIQSWLGPYFVDVDAIEPPLPMLD
jgi:hypothetical protein